jgi:hypothetical protein
MVDRDVPINDLVIVVSPSKANATAIAMETALA